LDFDEEVSSVEEYLSGGDSLGYKKI